MVNPGKEVIVDITDEADIGPILAEMADLGTTKILTTKVFPADPRLHGLTTIGPNGGDLTLVGAGAAVGPSTALLVDISNSRDVEKAVGGADAGHAMVIVRCRNWVVIPLENLIAEFSRRGRKLYAMLENGEDLELLFNVLEKGVDGVVIPASMLQKAKTRLGFMREMRPLPFRGANVTRIVDVGVGERACIDTTSILQVGEGMLVGSKSNFLFLVHSETIPTDYIPTRQFRVNAGAIHSYVLGTGDRTSYLSELSSGDRVQVVNTNGKPRVVAIGRVKIERRPLVMVVARTGEEEGSVMLQKAETVRLVKSDSTPVAVTDLREGDEIIVHVAPTSGRHFGGEVDEFILER